MRVLTFALGLGLTLASPALADIDEVLDGNVLPGFDRFASAASDLADSARGDCTPASLRPAYHRVFDAWMGISHLQFGPLEADGRTLAIAFWPDTRGMGARTVARLIADRDPAVDDSVAFGEVSVAGRGLFALETLLFGKDYAEGSYECRLAIAMAVDLSRIAADMVADWQGYADVMRSAKAPGNAIYLSDREVLQELYTVLMTGLEFTKDQRLGRPLGTFDRPRPTRVEARQSGRSLRNVVLSIIALQDLAEALADIPIPHTDEAVATALKAAKLDDPVLEGVSDPTGRLKIEILQQKIGFIRDAIAAEIGAALGLSLGFNSADGD